MDQAKMTEARKAKAEPSVGYSPMKAIRAKCLDCCGGQQSIVDKCSAVSCSLWPLRYGTRPRQERGTLHAGRVMAGLTIKELSDARETAHALNNDIDFRTDMEGQEILPKGTASGVQVR
jgi:hypothetical protein